MINHLAKILVTGRMVDKKFTILSTPELCDHIPNEDCTWRYATVYGKPVTNEMEDEHLKCQKCYPKREVTENNR